MDLVGAACYFGWRPIGDDNLWAVYVIIPLVALANTGVAMGENNSALLLGRVSLGIIAGLVLGIPVPDLVDLLAGFQKTL